MIISRAVLILSDDNTEHSAFVVVRSVLVVCCL